MERQSRETQWCPRPSPVHTIPVPILIPLYYYHVVIVCGPTPASFRVGGLHLSHVAIFGIDAHTLLWNWTWSGDLFESEGGLDFI